MIQKIRIRINNWNISEVFLNSSGMSLVEFAFVLPILIILLVCGYQLCDAVSAYRKVTTTTKSMADLVSQYTLVTNSDLDTILNASVKIMYPYSPDNAVITLSQISIDNNNNPKVSWSRSLNGTALTVGSSYSIPSNINQANTSLIIATTTYAYTPTFASSIIGTMNFGDKIILSPRRSPSVVWK